MPKSPTLYKLAADRKYSSIPDRVQTNPSDLLWTDRYGSTALHILCQARTVDQSLLRAVDAILSRAPELVAWANVATWTPLHFAVERRLLWGEEEPLSATHTSTTTELILRLLKACPSAVSLRTRSGYKTKTPFHIACEAAADYKVLKAMLQINPALATEPFAKRDAYAVTENPLQLLWKAHLHNSASSQSGSSNRRHLMLAEKKMTLLLQAAHCGTVARLPEGRSFRLLNAACSVRTPRDYFTRILSQHRDQVSIPDQDGMVPIHYAVKSATADSQVYTQYVLEALLSLYPQAAALRDPQSRLPLHVAIGGTYMTWHKGGIRSLTYANVSALREPDPRSGLLPFLASAEAAIKSRLHLSTTYELLRVAPDVVQLCRQNMNDGTATTSSSSSSSLLGNDDIDEDDELLESLR